MKRSLILGVAIAALALISGCDDENSPAVAAEGDYFPAHPASRRFLREQFTHPDLSYRYYYDTIRIAASPDTLMAGTLYHRLTFYSFWESASGIIESSDTYRYFRKEGSRYLTPSPTADNEEVFLDTSLPVGSSWTYESADGDLIGKYTIKAVHATKQFNGVMYNDVIEVEFQSHYRNNDGVYRLLHVQNRCFAKDVGEVYSLSAFYSYTTASRISTLE